MLRGAPSPVSLRGRQDSVNTIVVVGQVGMGFAEDRNYMTTRVGVW